MNRSLFVFLYFLYFSSFAQTKEETPAPIAHCDCFIHGVVLDNATKQPIVGAVVFVKEQNKGTTTDVNGHYHIANLCQGTYTVIGRIVGYQEKTYTIKLVHEAEQEIKLSEGELHLANIDIKAEKIDNLTQTKNV
jgi:iron complex outermembrane receptor protein